MLARSPKVPSAPVRWGVFDAAAVFLGAQVLQSVWFVIVLLSFGLGLDDEVSVAALLVGQLASVAAYLGGSTLVSRKRGAGPVADFGSRVQAIDIPIGAAAGVLTQFVLLWLLYLPINELVDGDAGDAARRLFDRADGSFDRVLLFVMVVVIAPVIEEFFFRGLLLRSLQQRLGAWPAVVVSSIVFAAAHFQGLQFPGLFVVGLVAAILTVRSGRLGPALFMHMAFNLGTYVLLVSEAT